jgi:hypothetical protein
MKKLALVGSLIIPLLVVAGFVVNDKSASKEPVTTFYETPLVCGAAPKIGCGSRAKPALLALEKNPAVKEAWLNRPGTVIAIVWKDKDQTKSVAAPVFNENSIEFTALNTKDASLHKRSFRQPKEWYRGGDVDELSKEEATIIGETSVKFALENNLITKEEAAKIKSGIEAYFKIELVKLRTVDQLNEDVADKFMHAMFEIAEKHIGKERTEKAMELYFKGCEQECKKDASCQQPGTKGSCCEKTKQ